MFKFEEGKDYKYSKLRNFILTYKRTVDIHGSHYSIAYFILKNQNNYVADDNYALYVEKENPQGYTLLNPTKRREYLPKWW